MPQPSASAAHSAELPVLCARLTRQSHVVPRAEHARPARYQTRCVCQGLCRGVGTSNCLCPSSYKEHRIKFLRESSSAAYTGISKPLNFSSQIGTLPHKPETERPPPCSCSSPVTRRQQQLPGRVLGGRTKLLAQCLLRRRESANGGDPARADVTRHRNCLDAFVTS